MRKQRENKFINKFISAMRHDMKLTRIETSTSIAVPDMLFTVKLTPDKKTGVTGWIEAKAVEEWPKKNSTKLKIHHIENYQIAFAIDTIANGGVSWFLIEIGFEILLLDPFSIKALNNAGATAEKWKEASTMLFSNISDLKNRKKEFLKKLCKNS